MGLVRRALEGAVGKLERLADRVDGADLSKLTPAEREHYELWEARTAAARAGEELGDARLVGAVLRGPAGEALHGIAAPPPTPPAIEDAAAWEQQATAERGARDERRVPYLAPARAPVHFTRIATGGTTSEVLAHLAASGLAARPDLVYGVYRVPDRITSGWLGGEAIVEWDVVHAAGAPLPAAAEPELRYLDANRRLVDRAAGERAPLDEDVALDLLDRAGIGPERTLGIARATAIRLDSGDGDAATPRLWAAVHGVTILTADPVPVDDGPRTLADGPPAGTHLDVLHWEAIAAAVHPVRQQRAPLPSPFPYLPRTPQELLQAYLEIVGIAPRDAYAAQVTYDRPLDLLARSSARTGVRRTGGGPDLPCADGKSRQRMAGGHQLVIAYRDTPAYADGRARFDAYAATELYADLRLRLGLRPPVPKPAHGALRAFDRIADAVNLLAGETGAEDGFVAPRYCWPPRDA